MGRSAKLLATVVGSALMVGTAAADDAGSPMAFNWDRYYVGVAGGAWLDFDPFGIDDERADLLAGRNFQVGPNAVVGFEGTFGIWDFSDPAVEIGAYTRAGFLAGQNVLLFATAGAMWDFYHEEGGLMLGTGVEFATSSNFSIRTDFAFWIDSAGWYPTLTGGFVWHVGD